MKLFSIVSHCLISEFLHIWFSFSDFLNFPVLQFFFPFILIFFLFVLPIFWLQFFWIFPFDELLPRCIILMRYKSHVTCLATHNLCSRRLTSSQYHRQPGIRIKFPGIFRIWMARLQSHQILGIKVALRKKLNDKKHKSFKGFSSSQSIEN